MFPKVHVDLEKYKHNTNHIQSLLESKGVSLMAVTKVFCAEQPFIDIINDSKVDVIGDSRIANLKKMKTKKPKALVRIPMISEVEDVLNYADMSLQSEINTMRVLNDAAKKSGKSHDIILMFDLGDLREGIYYNSAYETIVLEVESLTHIHLKGIGTNLTCYGGVIPTLETYEKLETIKQKVETLIKRPLEIISGGNSSSVLMLLDEHLPTYINQLRIGETLVLGRETAYGNHMPYMHDDIFRLEAEIIELKDKPSHPEGILGMDAFGQRVKFFDKGQMKRAILGVGRQDVNCEDLIPPKDVIIIGCSSDHLIVELLNDSYKVGDTLIFKLTYAGILRVMTSSYVEKVYG